MKEKSFGRVYLWGEIDSSLAKGVISRIRYHVDRGIKKIYLYIHTDGGDFDACCAIIDEIEGYKSQKIEINTIAQGMAYSAGAFILMVGTYRYATKLSDIMFHQLSANMGDDTVYSQKGYADYSHDMFTKFIDECCKYCSASFKKKLLQITTSKKELYLSAEDAIKAKVIDGIWDYAYEMPE